MKTFVTALTVLSVVLAAQLPLGINVARDSDESPSFLSLGRWTGKTAVTPPNPPRSIDFSEYTIAELLKKSYESHHTDPRDGPPRFPPLQKLAFFVNLTDEVKELLDSEDAHLTLFAPDDFALTPPGHGEHDHEGHHHHERKDHDREGQHHREHEHDEALQKFMQSKEHPMHAHMRAMESNADDDDEDRKEKFIKLLTFILKYHVLDSGSYLGRELATNSTVQSALGDTRIRVRPFFARHPYPHPALSLNFLAQTRGPTIICKNGIIHPISKPLLPPLPALEELFVVPFIFSELTSGLQKVDLDDVLHPHAHTQANLDEVHPIVSSLLNELAPQGGREFTVFAPTNRAFFKLGFELNGFLFSPFGRKILKDVLAYHIIPDVAFYSDHISNSTTVPSLLSTAAELPQIEEDHYNEDLVRAGLRDHHHHHDHHGSEHGGPHRPPPYDVRVKQYSLTTLFNDTKLPVDVYEEKAAFGAHGEGPIFRSIFVGDAPGKNGRVQVLAEDVPALKGAVHVVGSLIRPPQFPAPPEHHHEHHHHEHHQEHHHHGHHHEHHHHEHHSSRRGSRSCKRNKSNGLLAKLRAALF